MRFKAETEGVDGLRGYLARIKGTLIDADALLRAAGLVKEGVLKRTSSGVDAGGRPFKPYAKAYKKRRERAGMRSDTVDLSFTGAMLGDLVCIVRGAEAEITFSSAKSIEKARGVEGGGGRRGGATRSFLGVDTGDHEAAANIFSEHIDKVLTSKDIGR